MAAAVAEEVPMTDLRESPMALFRSQVTEDEKSSSLGGVDVSAEEGRSRKMKKPKRILHFSDGTLEEYSTDEEDETDKQQELDPLALVDPKSLTWGPWMYYWMLYTGSSALAACDYVGESLANFLGITSPKYQYEIDEYHRSLQEEKERKEEEDAEMAGWRSPGSTNEANTDQGVPISSIQQPSSLHGLNEDNPENSSSIAEVNGGNEASPVPSVIVTSETYETSPELMAAPLPQKQDSTNWERF